MKKLFVVLVALIFLATSAYAISWTKSWTSADDGSPFSGSDIEDIQDDINTQTPTLTGANNFSGANTFSGTSTFSGASAFSGASTFTGTANFTGATVTGAGTVVQVKNVTTGAATTGVTLIPHDNTIPQNTEGDEKMTLAITPTLGTNKLRIDVVVCCAYSVASPYIAAALFQDAGANALAVATISPNDDEHGVISYTYYMTAGTTAATTFKVRIGGDPAGTCYFNTTAAGATYGGVMASSITITEIIP